MTGLHPISGGGLWSGRPRSAGSPVAEEGAGPIFAVGCPRSGTMTFAHQMSRQPLIEAFHEGVSVKGGFPNMSYLFQSINPSSEEVEWNRRVLRERLNLANQIHPTRLCESNNTLSMNLDIVQECFPKAKVIHLVRPAIEQVISRYGGYVVAFGTTDKIPKPLADRSTWRFIGDSAIWLPHDNLFELAAKVWQVQNETIAKTGLPRIVVETHDLSLPETWRRVFDFCEMDAIPPDLGMILNVGHRSRKENKILTSRAAHYCSIHCTWKWK